MSLSIASHKNSANRQFFHCRRTVNSHSHDLLRSCLCNHHLFLLMPDIDHSMTPSLPFSHAESETRNVYVKLTSWCHSVSHYFCQQKSPAKNKRWTKSYEITSKTLQPQSLHFHSHWSRWWWLSHPHHHQIHHHHPHEPQHPERSKNTPQIWIEFGNSKGTII